MSMRDEMKVAIREHCAAGNLILVEPMIPCAQVRPIYMVRELHAEAYGTESDLTAHNLGVLEADLRRIIVGDHVTVARGDEPTCMLKPLSNVREVWEVRSRGAKPSLRVFFRFAATDVLIATNMAYRPWLGVLRSRAWAVAARRCQTTWSRYFPHLEPHTGSNLNEYISSNVIDLDDDIS